jgi:drug/metabolite transporter (DMT)-like permease
MLFLVLTIACSTSITLILKQNDIRQGDTILLLAANYLVASLISLIVLLGTPEMPGSSATLLFGALLGIFFVGSFFAFAKAVCIAGTALAAVSSRLSVIIPIVLSIFFFHEIPAIRHDIGFILTILTILLFYVSLKSESKNRLRGMDTFYLLAVLVGIGINDFAMKIFEQCLPASEKPFFLFSIFSFSFLYTAVFILLNKIRLETSTALRGAVLGIPNIFSTFFLLGALSRLPAILVYPSVNMGVILLTTLGAAVIWKEKLNGYGRWALVTGLTAILLFGI